jgi:DNA-binding phage protein
LKREMMIRVHLKYLRNNEIALEYIKDALESNDTNIIIMALEKVIEAHLEDYNE